jgi:c-di-GMP-binding flagellar brake protein YcgR
MHLTDRTDRGMEWLDEAIAEQAPVTLHIKTKLGWTIAKSRFLGGSREARQITVACPSEILHKEVIVSPGWTLGVAFRHAHKKCIFETEVLALERGTAHQSAALVVRWPAQMQQFQRRVYSRTPVPDHLTIPVNVSKEVAVNDAPPPMPKRGILLDLSAGGMSIAVTRDQQQRWRRGDVLKCLVPLEPAHEPRALTGRLCHLQTTPQGHMRMGLQFVGLEGSAEGLETLQSIARATSRFRCTQRRGFRRL